MAVRLLVLQHITACLSHPAVPRTQICLNYSQNSIHPTLQGPSCSQVVYKWLGLHLLQLVTLTEAIPVL
jgi:hypothetical protein